MILYPFVNKSITAVSGFSSGVKRAIFFSARFFLIQKRSIKTVLTKYTPCVIIKMTFIPYQNLKVTKTRDLSRKALSLD